MRKLRNIVTGLLLTGVLTASAADFQSTTDSASIELQTASAKEEQETVNVKEIVFGHIGDSYEWHITSWGDTHLIIPLPVILYSSATGWHAFLSSRLEENGGSYEGFSIAPEGSRYEGKLVEHDAAGNEVRPFDISITKVTLALLMNSVLLLVLILGVARWYRKHPQHTTVPGGFVGLMEMFVMMVNDDVIKSCIGPNYRKFAPYLLTAFFFIFINNLMGLVPFFSGWRQRDRQHCHYDVSGTLHFHCGQCFRNKSLLERYLLARCSMVAEGACTYDAHDRAVGNFHQTVCLDDSSFRQYVGGTHGDAGTDVPHLHHGKHGTGLERFVDICFCAFQYLYECVGTACRFHSGVCIHHAVCGIHRIGSGERPRRKRREGSEWIRIA